MTDRIALARELFAALMAQDRQVAERLLAENFTFAGPYDDRIDRAAYLERCWPTADLFATQETERLADDGEAVFVTYRAVRHDGLTFRNTECLTFVGDRIAAIAVFFGASYRDG